MRPGSAARRVIPLVLAALAAAAVPSPQSHFGHQMGADRAVLDWDRVVSYFQALENSSDRIRVKELGKSTEGRPFLAVTIAAPSTLRNLDRYAWIQKKLADPRITPEAEAEKLIGEGKAVVLITCSIHSTELASTQTAIEFAYRLLTEDTPRFRAILDNTIFLLVPSLNPDGVDIVTRWYRKTLGTPFEGTSPPELYQKYTGHDNNRDWYFFTQAETRLTVAQLHNVWHPQIVYDVHQQGPFASRMFVPPWMDPIEPNIDPILAQECNLIGAGIAVDLTAAGKTGVVMNALYDLWSPSRHYQAYHGGLRILTESASARLATPITVRPGQIELSAPGYLPRERSWNYLQPWLGGEWRLRDIVDYQLIAMESVLYQAATRREDLLRNFYRIGRRAVARTSPWAFVIPAAQRDPVAAAKLIETLAFGQVEIERAVEAFEAGDRKYGSGTYVIRMQQPYSSFAKTLLERQRYPDLRLYPGGPPMRPYDVTAHTLPLLMGVQVDSIDAPVAVPLAPLSGEISSKPSPLSVAARIGLYKSFVPSIDEGWTRWVLEQFGVPYHSTTNTDVLRGYLRRRFDVLIFPNQAAAVLANGYPAGGMPDEYTGGLGEKGAQALKRFVFDGGTLVFLNRSTGYAITTLGLNLAPVEAGDYYSPGSLLNVTLDSASPLAQGLPAGIAIWSEASPAWAVPDGSPARVVARYPQSGILASGWLLGEKHLAGKAALLDYPMGAGRVILFGMRPQYRGQSYQTFKLLFNVLAPAPPRNASPPSPTR
jgi:Zinc carboxypeptidase